MIVPPEIDSTKTTREQFEELTKSDECAGCHALMNPIGFGFEHYDGIGLWRDEQSGKPIDASGEVFDGEDIGGPFDGVVELAGKLAQSDTSARAWPRSGSASGTAAPTRRRTPATSIRSNEVFAESGHDIRELLVALTQTDAFLYRHGVVAGELPSEEPGEGGEP